MDSYIYYIGMVSSLLLTITPISLVISTYRIKSVKDISIYFMMFQIIASSGFVLYGSLIYEIWIIIPNATFVLANIILIFFKFYFDSDNKIKENEDICSKEKKDICLKEINIIG